jgi:hypothetical protein
MRRLAALAVADADLPRLDAIVRARTGRSLDELAAAQAARRRRSRGLLALLLVLVLVLGLVAAGLGLAWRL